MIDKVEIRVYLIADTSGAIMRFGRKQIRGQETMDAQLGN